MSIMLNYHFLEEKINRLLEINWGNGLLGNGLNFQSFYFPELNFLGNGLLGIN